MSLVLALICFIWLLVIQQRLDKISVKLDLLSKSGNETQIKVDPKVEITQEEPPVEEKYVETVTEPLKTEPVSSVKYPFEKQPQKSDLQGVFLGNIFNKIGALAIIIAMIILIKLVSPFIVITPLMKVIFGFAVGGGMALGALYMHRKDELKGYSEVLLGTGFATLFITTFCAYSMFHIFNSVAAITLGAILLFATFVIAQQMKTVSMLVIGLIGGYLTPCFSGVKYEVALGYLIFLNLVSLIFTLRNERFNWLNCVNLLITMFAFCPYVVEPAKPLFPLTLWGIYIIYDLLRNKNNKVDTALTFINYVVLTLFLVILFRSIHNYIGYLLLGTGLVYSVSACYSYKLQNTLYKNYVYFMLLNLWLGVYFLLPDVLSVFVWSLAAVILAGAINSKGLKFLNPAFVWYLGTAVAGTFLAKYDGQFCLFAKYMPLVNMRTLVFSFPILATFISAMMFEEAKDEKSFNLLLLNGVSLIYLYLVGELNFLNLNKGILYSMLGFIYAVNCRLLYKSNNCMLFNVVSWVIYGFSLLILLISGIDYHTQTGYVPVLNLKVAAYVLSIYATLTLGKHDLLKYLAVFLGFLLVQAESVGAAYLHSNMSYIISLSWVLYSGAVTVCGILSERRYLINSGIAIIILTIFRIFIFDLAKVDALYKLIAFLALGIILMYVSYLYTTHQKKLK